MLQTESVTKALQLKIRVDESDKKRLEELALHFSAPAATVVRMLVKEKHDAVVAARQGQALPGEAHDVMSLFSSGVELLTSGDIARGMNDLGHDAKWKGLPSHLNHLCRGGWLKRQRGTGEREDGKFTYEITAKGRAYCQANWR